MATAAVDTKVEKLCDAVTKLDEMSSDNDKAWVVSIVPQYRSGEGEHRTPTGEVVVPPAYVRILAPAPQAVASTVTGGQQPRGRNKFPLLRDNDFMTFCIRTVTALKLWCRSVVDKMWNRNIQLPGRIDQDIEASMISGVVDEPQQRLPLSDTELSTFLVKASELSVNGMLALNGASVTALYMWIYHKQALGDMSKSVCENSYLKTFISLAPVGMYLLTALVSSIATAIEQDPIGLSVISGFVLAFFVWPVFLGGLMTHCVTGAAIWIIVLLTTPLILIILATWATIFNHPKILRRCFSWCNCCGRAHVAAAQHADGASEANN